MEGSLIQRETLLRMPAPADLFVGTWLARPISVRNVIAFRRTRARELGDRRNFHHRFVLCINLRDSVSIDLVVDNVALRLAPGRYVLFLPHQVHTYTGLDDREICVFFITFETADANLLYPLSDRVMNMTPSIEAALSAFIEVYATDYGARRGSHIVLAAQILLESIILNNHDGGEEARIPMPAPLEEALLRIAGGEAATALSIAKEIGISEAYLRKLFKKNIGVSLGRYLKEMRQNKARSLLGASDESVSHIAELCGYKSVYAFSRSFRVFNGCTASQYRERMRRDRLSEQGVEKPC